MNLDKTLCSQMTYLQNRTGASIINVLNSCSTFMQRFGLDEIILEARNLTREMSFSVGMGIREQLLGEDKE